jgi:HD superfamily phosphodiesterase
MKDIFREIRDEKAEISASNLYSKKLAFHNFFHVIETLKFANRIINSLLIEPSTINVETIYYALLFHDAGYIEDQASMGYADKESYSAALAEEYLLGRGMPMVHGIGSSKKVSKDLVLSSRLKGQCPHLKF